MRRSSKIVPIRHPRNVSMGAQVRIRLDSRLKHAGMTENQLLLPFVLSYVEGLLMRFQEPPHWTKVQCRCFSKFVSVIARIVELA